MKITWILEQKKIADERKWTKASLLIQPIIIKLLLTYLYRIVVLPAPSKPSIKILVSFGPNSPENMREKRPPNNKEKLSCIFLKLPKIFLVFTLTFLFKKLCFFHFNQLYIEMQIFYLHSGGDFKLSINFS